MYIKQIIIQGFKSYKDQMVIEPFSPGTNVVVGRNGSGKSNFFAAIRFVLSDAYTQLSREERQALLHEGSGSAVMSAYVEIIFDNSDNRFPTDHKEVVLRRTISLKKDEYSIDKKVTTLKEVNQFLESAGFSKSNPYYIVPQGRVTALTNMRESERLTLLKEVAGTQVYEARRAESLKIMNDTNNKREKIDELLEYIKERLSELEEEKEELRGYQDKDRERRCLEYAYYHKDQVAVQEALEELEEARQGGIDDTDENREAYTAGEKVIAQLDAEIHKLQQQMELLRIDRRQLDEDRRESAKARAKSELAVKALSDSMSAQDQAKQQHDAELAQVRKAITSKEAELAKILPEYEKRKTKEYEIKQELDTAEAGRQRLFTKQTRSSQFRNKAERDAFLKKEINDLNLTLSQQKATRLDAEEEVKNKQSSIKQLEKDVANLRSKNEGFGNSRIALADEVTGAKDNLEKLQEERKLLRREEDKLDAILSNARRERDRAERELSYTMDGETSRGLATIRRLRQEKDIPGAFGTLAELLDVNEAYRVPVEQVAGASLFHYIVDNEETATYFMNALQRTRGGRVTFAPLSKLHPRPANLPRANDAVPLVSKIQYDPTYDAAFQQVFGRTIICPNLTVAGQYARSHNCDAITPEGDTTNKRGAMTGGYIDPGKSRLQAVRNATKWREEYEQLLSQSSSIKKEIEKKEQEITYATGELRKREQKLRQMDDSYGPLRAELNAKSVQIGREQDHLEAAIKRRETVDRNMKDFGDTLNAHEAELSSDFKKALSANEEQQLESLSQSVQDLQKQWTEISRARRELEGRKQILDAELRNNLQLKLDQLTSQAFENGAGGSSGNLKEAQRELKKAQKAVASVETRLQENEQQIESTEANIGKLEKQKAAKDLEQQELARDIQKQQKRMEKGIQKKALLTTRAIECAKNIRDLGVLPEEAFEKYERLESKSIASRLKKVNDALKKYKHVNKKAFEQYNSFTTQQDQLLKRRKELDQSQESIEELVAHLDQRKDEAIERTFKQVSKEFATIFERLVPAGQGRLVIQRKADRRVDPEESDEEQRGSVENYTGVGISVSFNSKQFDEQQRIQQLSGGQKSLCALCLIFALQQTESSPMVIFDEVDANLDAQYRTAVAGLLDSISKEAGTQFICTTFRPEIVLVADKCYGVTFRNKNSNINCVPTEQALDFVEGQAPR
ncbi:Chromosome segregation protein sudA [Pestalotiopsis fici W106-1]|uniref:Structural maintenance of chromosomes protein n=1 Tax=Pestalotiopsis fici (strain W106-1 / CGMCC3.15140) TaxID=1229662 RepID=W3XBB2_PESFW|nr:Chromosome segregation protein sudA [Pestalotiopsis fici W106-1]ETS83373.1 Chromosome segregation protein sudA [Pestalotiopsis fici W106-1]